MVTIFFFYGLIWFYWIFGVFVRIQLFRNSFFLFQITSIVLITSTTHIDKAPRCDLKKALDFLDLKYTSQPCKYNGVKEISNELFKLGKGVLSWNFIVFIGTLVLYFGPSFEHKLIIIYIHCAIVSMNSNAYLYIA